MDFGFYKIVISTNFPKNVFVFVLLKGLSVVHFSKTIFVLAFGKIY